MSFEMPKEHCPCCGHHFDRASNVSDPPHHPEPGDVTVCFYCLEILIVGEGLSARLPTPEELAEMQQGPEWTTIEKIRWARKQQMAEMN